MEEWFDCAVFGRGTGALRRVVGEVREAVMVGLLLTADGADGVAAGVAFGAGRTE